MATKGSYVPPQYVPLYGLDTEEDRVPPVEESHATHHKLSRDPAQWSSGICACFDDPQSCCIGATCPCFLFGKNAQFLGSGTLAGSCTTHCMLWGLLTNLCCIFTGGLVLAVPGSAVACYACGYRSALRTKYNLPGSRQHLEAVTLQLMHAAKSMKLNLLVFKETVLCLPQCIRYNFVEQYSYTGYHENASLLISVPQDWELRANLNRTHSLCYSEDTGGLCFDRNVFGTAELDDLEVDLPE